MSTKQCFVNGNLSNIVASSTVYNSVQGSAVSGNGHSFSENGRIQIVPNSATLRNMRFKLNTAVTAGSFTFTLRLNGADTAITATISSGSVGSDLANSVSVVADDEIAFKAVSVAGTNTVQLTGWSIEYESDADSEFVLMAGSSFQITGSGDVYNGVIGMDAWSIDPSPRARDSAAIVVPFDCTLQAFYVVIQTQPGGGKSWIFDLFLNGVAQVSTSITIAHPALRGNLTGIGLALTEGDLLLVHGVRSGTAAATKVAYGFLLDNTVDGESIMGGHSQDLLSGLGVTEFNLHDRGFFGWGATERKSYAAIGFDMSDMRVFLSAAPTALRSRTFTNRVNGGDGNLVVAMTGVDVNKKDGVNTDTIVATDEIGIKHIATGPSDPAAAFGLWSARQFIALPVAAVGGRTQGTVSISLGAIDV